MPRHPLKFKHQRVLSNQLTVKQCVSGPRTRPQATTVVLALEKILRFEGAERLIFTSTCHCGNIQSMSPKSLMPKSGVRMLNKKSHPQIDARLLFTHIFLKTAFVANQKSSAKSWKPCIWNMGLKWGFTHIWSISRYPSLQCCQPLLSILTDFSEYRERLGPDFQQSHRISHKNSLFLPAEKQWKKFAEPAHVNIRSLVATNRQPPDERSKPSCLLISHICK